MRAPPIVVEEPNGLIPDARVDAECPACVVSVVVEDDIISCVVVLATISRIVDVSVRVVVLFAVVVILVGAILGGDGQSVVVICIKSNLVRRRAAASTPTSNGDEWQHRQDECREDRHHEELNARHSNIPPQHASVG